MPGQRRVYGHAPSPNIRFVRKPNRVSDGDLRVVRRSGPPMPFAGRSLRHPASALSMLPALRHPGSAGQQRRLPGTGSPSLATVMHRSGDTSHPRDTSHPKSPERERGDGRRPRNGRGGSQRWIHSLALVASWRSELAHPGCEVVTGAVRSRVNRLFSRIFRSFRGVRPVFPPPSW